MLTLPKRKLVFCAAGAQVVELGTVRRDLINGSIGRPAVRDGVSLSDGFITRAVIQKHS